MWLHFTLVYHPKDNGQTKYTNQTLKQYLLSLFFTNKKYYPNITIHFDYNIASFQAHDFTIDLDKLQSTLNAEISVA